MQHEREETALVHLHTLEYIGIVLCLLLVFLLLVFAGTMKFSGRMLKATNIVAFIFLFELIIMSTEEAIDHYIWPIIEFPVRLLLMRILVVGMLSPIHHWVEETMLHYLKKRGMLQPEKRNWRKWFSHFFQKHQTPPANQELHEEPATASTTLNDKSDPAEAPVS